MFNSNNVYPRAISVSGAFTDPATILDAYANFADPTSLFQDTGGTVPVTTMGQNVLSVKIGAQLWVNSGSPALWDGTALVAPASTPFTFSFTPAPASGSPLTILYCFKQRIPLGGIPVMNAQRAGMQYQLVGSNVEGEAKVDAGNRGATDRNDETVHLFGATWDGANLINYYDGQEVNSSVTTNTAISPASDFTIKSAFGFLYGFGFSDSVISEDQFREIFKWCYNEYA